MTASVRRLGEVVALTRDCELGVEGERAVVLALEDNTMTLVFPHRPDDRRRVRTGADYRYVKAV